MEQLPHRNPPQLFADHLGIQVDGVRWIEWDEIIRVGGYKLDCITSVATIVVLDHPCGEYIELQPEWPGFDQVITVITARLPGIAANWFRAIESLEVASPPITVWERR